MTTDDHLYLDRPLIRTLSGRLRDIHEWAAEALDDAVCRIVSHDRSPIRSDDRPLDINLHASDVAHDIHGTLRAWADHICQHSAVPWPGEQRTAEWAKWLDRHLIDLAKTEDAVAAYDEISDSHKRLMRVIDRPTPSEFVGPCQADGPPQCAGVYCPRGRDTTHCRTCDLTIDIPTVRAATLEQARLTLGTAAELAPIISRFADPTIVGGLNRKRITYLARRGLISGRRSQDGRPRFQLGEVIDAHLKLVERVS